MYAEVLTALAVAVEQATGIRPVRGAPLFGATRLTPPIVALVCDGLPLPPTRNGACSGAGALSWQVAVFGADEAQGLALAEALCGWVDGAPVLDVDGRRVLVKRPTPGERLPNEQQITELDHAFSVPLLTTW